MGGEIMAWQKASDAVSQKIDKEDRFPGWYQRENVLEAM